MSDNSPGKAPPLQTAEFEVQQHTRSARYQDVYANNIRGGLSPWDLMFHFGVVDDLGDAAPFVREEVTIRLSPQTFKFMVLLATQMMQQWERQNGPISINAPVTRSKTQQVNPIPPTPPPAKTG